MFVVKFILNFKHGGHGIMVITGGCGPLNTGSIPVGHPKKLPASTGNFFISQGHTPNSTPPLKIPA